MPAGPRIRTNNAFGTTLNNPLAAGGTTLNSVELAILSEVVAAHAIITLDPLRQFGEPELVIVTAHAPGAQTATIVRGAYSTIARAHPVGTIWLHGPINDDVISIVTTTTRPTDPYMGQIIYESNLNKYSSYTGAAWVGLIPPGLISSYGADVAPAGWLSCAGAAVSRTTYADLFAAIGVNYGAGDTVTTFNLPNLQDKFPLGKGSTFATLGAVGGNNDAVVVSHNHTQNSHNHTQDSHNHTQNGHFHSHSHGADTNFTEPPNHGHTFALTKVRIPGAHAHDSNANELAQNPTGAGSAFASAYIGSTAGVDTALNHRHGITNDVTDATAVNQAFTATNQGQTATNIATGSSGTNANMPSYQVVRYIIKV